MADSTRTKGETWPPERFQLKDDKGELVDIASADKAEALIFDGVNLIRGDVEAISPPDEDEFNARYVWNEGDLDNVGDKYDVEIKVTWDESSTPPRIQFFPNKNPKPSFEIVDNNEGP